MSLGGLFDFEWLRFKFALQTPQSRVEWKIRYQNFVKHFYDHLLTHDLCCKFVSHRLAVSMWVIKLDWASFDKDLWVALELNCDAAKRAKRGKFSFLAPPQFSQTLLLLPRSADESRNNETKSQQKGEKRKKNHSEKNCATFCACLHIHEKLISRTGRLTLFY